MWVKILFFAENDISWNMHVGVLRFLSDAEILAPKDISGWEYRVCRIKYDISANGSNVSRTFAYNNCRNMFHFLRLSGKEKSEGSGFDAWIFCNVYFRTGFYRFVVCGRMG